MTTIDTINRGRVEVCVDGLEVTSVWHDEVALLSKRGANLAAQRMYARQDAPGQPVVLVHGFAQNRFSWHLSGRSMQAYLASKGFDTWNVELRGHGRSRDFGSVSPRRFDDYVDDLQTVCDALDQPPFAIGHSLGGAVIAAAATRMPVRGIVPMGGLYGFATNERVLNLLTAFTLAFDRVVSGVPLSFNTKLLAPILTKNLPIADLWGYGLPIAGWVPGSVETDLLRERIELGFDWTSIEIWMQMCRWAQHDVFSYDADFRDCDTPLFVVLGDQDALLGVEDGLRCFEASGAEDKQAVVYNAYDHGCHWGHLDLVLGRSARAVVWPDIAEWMLARS